MCASKAAFFSYTVQAVTQQIAVTATPQCSPMPSDPLWSRSDPLWSRLETKRLPLPASQQLQRQIVITNDPHWLYLWISRCFFLFLICVFFSMGMNLSALRSLRPDRVAVPRWNMEKCLCRSVNATLLTILNVDLQLFLPLQVLLSIDCESYQLVRWPKESAEKWCKERYQAKQCLEPLGSMLVLRSLMFSCSEVTLPTPSSKHQTSTCFFIALKSCIKAVFGTCSLFDT